MAQKARKKISNVDWLRKRLIRGLPQWSKLMVLQHPEKPRQIEVLVDDGLDVTRGVLLHDTVGKLRDRDESGEHEAFFREFLKPFLKVNQ